MPREASIDPAALLEQDCAFADALRSTASDAWGLVVRV